MWKKTNHQPGIHEAGFVVTDFESFLNYSHLGLLWPDMNYAFN